MSERALARASSVAEAVGGALLGDAEERRVVLIAVAGGAELAEHLLDRGGERQRGVDFAARAEGDLEVLVVKVDFEAGGEVVARGSCRGGPP